jgi:hypothetical protein
MTAEQTLARADNWDCLDQMYSRLRDLGSQFATIYRRLDDLGSAPQERSARPGC